MAKLERVLGSTSCPSSIGIDKISGTIAYPAGSTVILYNPRTGAEAHLIGATKNNISALDFSNNGRFIVTGECGHDPKIRIWEILSTEGKFVGKEICELKHHIMGIGAVKFSIDDELIISVGNQHDKAIAVWNWRKECIIAKNNLTSHICAIDVSQNGEYFVTVGVRHVKFWNLSKSDDMKGILQGRSAILSDKRNNTFTDVVCASNNRCFALTSTRHLIEFQDKKLINSYETEEMVPYSLTTGDNWLFMGCDNGDIEVYDIDTLEKVTRLPKPHWLGCDPQLIKDGGFFNSDSHPSGSRYPNVHSMVYWKKLNYLTVFYSDRSYYTWSISKDLIVRKISSSNFHVGAIFGLEIYPFNDSPYLSQNTFFTCGADDTIRVWNIQRNDSLPSQPSVTNNIYSKDLKKTIFFCESYDILNEQPRKNFTTVASDVLDSQTGIRCLKVSPNGKELAGGFRNGNIIVLDLTKPDFNRIFECEAHEDEIRCMEYSKYNDSTTPFLFATASRDRNIHIFDPLNQYSHLYVVKECSSTVTSLLFANYDSDLFLYTAAADKLVIINKITRNEKELSVDRQTQISCNSGINSVVLSPEGNLTAACHDKTIRVISKTGKEMNTIKGTISNQGQAVKICLDPSGIYAAITCSDRYTYIIEMSSGNCVAVLGGQSDSIASVSFSPDCKSISPDSVIESASDSASIVGSKKNQIHSGSNFGSITSVQITGDEDDLDSGVGIQQNPSIVVQDNLNNRDKSFLHRIPNQDTLRTVEIDFSEKDNLTKSQPYSNNFICNNGNIIKATPSIDKDNTIDINDQMLNTASPNHIQHHPYVSSRSMSNIHHGEQLNNSGGQRTNRRRWGALGNSSNSPIVTNTVRISNPQTPINNNNNYSSYQQPSTSMTNSKSLGSIRSQMMDEMNNSQLNNNSTPRASTMNLRSQILESNRMKSNNTSDVVSPSYSQFRRGTNGVRNSISKRVNNSDSNSVSSPGSERKTSLSCFSSAGRRQSSLFHGSTQNLRGSGNDKRPPPGNYTQSPLHLRSRSQSPSTLALNQELIDQNRRRDSSTTLGGKSLYSSKSNLRTLSSATLGQSSSALNKLTEMRNKLRKSQENLALSMALEDQEIQEDKISNYNTTNMSRSRSIGNLKLTTVNNSINIGSGAYHNRLNQTPDLKTQRSKSLAKSATNLDDDEEEYNQPQKMNSRFSSSIKNLQKSSKPDLTDLSLYDNTSQFEKESNDENLNGSYFSIATNKLRKGAVQKRVERSQPKNRLYSKLDQGLTSGDSDSNASDVASFTMNQSPYHNMGFSNTYSSKNGSSTTSSTPQTPTEPDPYNISNRTISSIETSKQYNTPNQFRRFAPNGLRKGSNYFAQKLEEGSPAGNNMMPPTNIITSPDLVATTPAAQNMTKHVTECISEFQTCLDKLLSARHILSKDTTLPKECTEYLLQAIEKVSGNARNRL
uniref:WD_REPEATS_REGION domain-containing protein n=1 Tax=Parastrongyloides trichosuri TaxID=131310 RepID=A0A0N4Z6W6_PARTI